MCEPTTTTLLYLTIASTVASAAGQYIASNEQTEIAEEQAQNQSDEAAAARDEAMGERVRESRRERARIRVSAGESGISGASFEAQLKNSLGKQNQDMAVMQKQAGFTQRSIKTNARSNSGGFGGLQAGLQIASGTLGAINSSRKAPKAAKTA